MLKNKEQLRGITGAAPLKNGSLPGAAQKDKDKKQEKMGGREKERVLTWTLHRLSCVLRAALLSVFKEQLPEGVFVWHVVRVRVNEVIISVPYNN